MGDCHNLDKNYTGGKQAYTVVTTEIPDGGSASGGVTILAMKITYYFLSFLL